MWGIELQRRHEVPLSRQIYQAFREQISMSRLKPDEALPSTRELAVQLGVSRSTVCEAYEMLLSEGFVISRQGAPTRVAPGLHLDKPPAFHMPDEPQGKAPVVIDFGTGQPDMENFPQALWGRLLCKAFEDMPLSMFNYTGPDGLPALREEVAAWLLRSRGLKADPRDIFITVGATQALHLLTGLLLSDGREMLIEDPCHSGMRKALQGEGYPLRPVPVDAAGLQTDLLEQKEACAVYVTPSHQFPLGGILPACRRTALIRFARENGSYIIEDDYDSEFRYSGAPVSPLYAMDPERVIYVGTFSKIVFPALRIGYVILPKRLHAKWRRLRVYADVQNPVLEQAALAEFLKTRKLDRHVQKMRRLYAHRRAELLLALGQTFGDSWRAWGDASGLHIALEFSGRCFDSNFMSLSREMGLHITPVEHHSIMKGNHQDKLLIGYGHLGADAIEKGIGLLHDVCRMLYKLGARG